MGENDSDNFVGHSVPRNGGLLQKRSNSLKTTSTVSTSGELDDPDDLFDPQEKLGFDFKFAKRFWQLQALLFVKFGSLPSILFCTIVLVSLLQEYVIYRVGLIPSEFYKVLGDKDVHNFSKVTLSSIGIIVAISVVKSIKQYLLNLLTVTWRQLLCRKIHSVYFTDISYFQLNVLDRKIDNPDQRITQDVDKFTTTYCDILPRVIIAPVILGYYTYKGFISTGWQGPAGCFGFFIIGTIFNKLLMGPIVSLVAEQEKCEGDFRFVHMKIRVNSESIAFHNAAAVECEKADDALLRLASAQHRLYFRQLFLNISMNLFDYLGSIVSYFIVAVPIFSGAYDKFSPSDISSLISKNAFISMYLIYQFSQLVDISIKITDIAGVTHRIAQLFERLKYLQSYWQRKFLPDPDDDSVPMVISTNLRKFEDLIVQRKKLKDIDNNQSEGESGDVVRSATPLTVPAWILDGVTFSAPFRQKCLIRDLTMTIAAGESLLIVGGSSAGKSSLLRILRGLWPYSGGTMIRLYPPGPQGVYYIPQKPYLTSGTIREQLAFPCKPYDIPNEDDDETIYNYFKMLKLKPLLERIGGLDIPVSCSLYESLSPGEVQRIYFIRVFLHRPIIAVLDEATSALPVPMESIVYNECQRLGITRISVGHRDSLKLYHDVLLTLDLTGGWKLENIPKNT